MKYAIVITTKIYLGEGPFDTREDAQDFIDAEVDENLDPFVVPIDDDDDWLVEDREEYEPDD